jgi:hypothetical protein
VAHRNLAPNWDAPQRAIALLSLSLRNVFFHAQAVFWALFALDSLTILLDLLLPAPRFT